MTQCLLSIIGGWKTKSWLKMILSDVNIVYWQIRPTVDSLGILWRKLSRFSMFLTVLDKGGGFDFANFHVPDDQFIMPHSWRPTIPLFSGRKFRVGWATCERPGRKGIIFCPFFVFFYTWVRILSPVCSQSRCPGRTFWRWSSWHLCAGRSFPSLSWPAEGG